MSEQHPDPQTHWKHRRRMAYASLVMLIVFGVAALVGRFRDAQVTLIEALAWVFAFIVVGYFGNNAMEAFAARGRK